MKNQILGFYKIIVPFNIRWYFWNLRYKSQLKKLKADILGYFSINYDKYEREIQFLKENELSVLPYESIFNYNPDFQIEFDKLNRNYFVVFEGKKMYFKRSMKPIEIKFYLLNLLKEQHNESPHRYLTEDYDVGNGHIVADIGVAEGIFSLSIIDKVKYIYMFEPDLEWVDALKLTFGPWESKIQIIPKFVSDISNSENITLDRFFIKDKIKIDFIKVDVDGFESKLLAGAEKTLKENSCLKVALCAYHNQNDGIEFVELLNKYGFECSFSKGYMLFYFDKNFTPPYFRKGIIRALK